MASRSTVERIACPRCARVVVLLADYFCPACGEHHDALYRAEHVAPERAAGMSREDIEREYADAGRAFRHDPKAEATASNLLQSEIMREIYREKGTT